MKNNIVEKLYAIMDLLLLTYPSIDVEATSISLKGLGCTSNHINKSISFTSIVYT